MQLHLEISPRLQAAEAAGGGAPPAASGAVAAQVVPASPAPAAASLVASQQQRAVQVAELDTYLSQLGMGSDPGFLALVEQLLEARRQECAALRGGQGQSPQAGILRRG